MALWWHLFLTTRTAYLLSDDPDLPTTQKQQVIENAMLHRIANVFDEFLCDAIRKVEGDLKAGFSTLGRISSLSYESGYL